MLNFQIYNMLFGQIIDTFILITAVWLSKTIYLLISLKNESFKIWPVKNIHNHSSSSSLSDKS